MGSGAASCPASVHDSLPLRLIARRGIRGIEMFVRQLRMFTMLCDNIRIYMHVCMAMARNAILYIYMLLYNVSVIRSRFLRSAIRRITTADQRIGGKDRNAADIRANRSRQAAEYSAGAPHPSENRKPQRRVIRKQYIAASIASCASNNSRSNGKITILSHGRPSRVHDKLRIAVNLSRLRWVFFVCVCT